MNVAKGFSEFERKREYRVVDLGEPWWWESPPLGLFLGDAFISLNRTYLFFEFVIAARRDNAG